MAQEFQKLTSTSLPEAIRKNNFHDVECIFEGQQCEVNAYYSNENYYRNWTLLGRAISAVGEEKEKKKIIQYLISKGANVNQSCREDIKLLPICEAAQRNLFLVQLLVENGAEINILDYREHSPLYNAFSSGNWEMLKYLVEKGAEINVKYNYYENEYSKVAQNRTLLFHLIKKHHVEMVKLLLNKNVKVDNESISEAIRQDNAELLDLLLTQLKQQSPDFDLDAIFNSSNETMIHLAGITGKLEVFKYLFEKGANIDVVNKYSNKRSLREEVNYHVYIEPKYGSDEYKNNFAIYHHIKNNEARIKSLQNTKREEKEEEKKPFYFDPSSQDTAVAKAFYESELGTLEEGNQKIREEEQKEIERQKKMQEKIEKREIEKNLVAQKEIKAKLLRSIRKNNINDFKENFDMALNAGIDLVGLELLHRAADKNAFLIIPVILNKNYHYIKILSVNIDSVNKENWTPLHIAAKQGCFEVVQELIEFQNPKAKIDLVDKDGWAPLHFAAYNGNLKVVKFLVEAGAKLDLLTNDGETVIALAKKHPKVSIYLKEALKRQQKSKQQNDDKKSSSSYAYSQNQTMWASEKKIDESSESEEEKTKNNKQ